MKQWINKVIHKSEQANIETFMQEIDAEIKALGDADKPALDRVLVDWGLTPEKVNKMTQETMVRMLAAVHLLKTD